MQTLNIALGLSRYVHPGARRVGDRTPCICFSCICFSGTSNERGRGSGDNNGERLCTLAYAGNKVRYNVL